MRFFQFRKLINYIADPKAFTKGTNTAPSQEQLQEEYKRFMKEDMEFMEQSKKKAKKSNIQEKMDEYHKKD